MKRRANKSKKVPNVRLRPAHPSAVARAARIPERENSECFIQDSQIVGSDDTVMLSGSCPRPFRHVVVCATGVADKTSLFKLALELGASSVSAFTDRVTHLVAEAPGGPKYQCALERKIPILQPSWILESHRIWQHGDDVDLDESVAIHRLPIFSGVTLCISGITDLVRRTKISKLINQHGGTYVKNLERPVCVTHLLCSGEDETEKMRYAEKFNERGEAKPPIQLVWEEWFWDCVEFGGRFDETRYQARLPRPERRVTTVISDVNVEPTPVELSSAYDEEGEEDEIVQVQRLPAVTLQVWGSLLKKRGYEVAGSGLMLSPGKARELVLKRRREQAKEAEETLAEGQSVLSSFRRANSLVVPRAGSVPPESVTAGPSRIPFARAASSRTPVNHTEPQAVEGSKNNVPGVFSGLRILLRGETDTNKVQEAVHQAGGTLVHDSETADFIVVRLVSGSALYRAETSERLQERYRTDCWLEHCLFKEALCDVDSNPCFAPLDIETPVPDADKIVFSFSGLDAAETCWIQRLVKALGVTLANVFSRQSTHLLCPSAAGSKFQYAMQWKIPVVDMGWLFEMRRTGVVPSVQAYLVDDQQAVKEKKSEIQEITKSCDSQEEGVLPPQSRSVSFEEVGVGPALSFGKARGLSIEPPRTPSPVKRHQSTPAESSKSGSNRSLVRRTTSTAAPRAGVLSSSPNAVVPSSVSPSPLRRGASVSPPKMSEERARVLQESMVSLLGKRAATPEDATSSRAAKRGRPARQPQSRQPSDALPVMVVDKTVVNNEMIFTGSQVTYEPLEGLSVGSADEQSLQVLYEDPAQLAEQQRLANLLGASMDNGKKRPRRTTRKGTR
ncbi:unnamed protein product [Mycena citricolor]|uniref:BRCT domain-containing protein n=1 Tax=Mycena citricolor TaxID=2018698 RepID=A0AAD2HIC6_9AGAR|nr:unnamed protein product [Mycena citricolor]